MKPIVLLGSLPALVVAAATVSAKSADPPNFYLRTLLKPHQPGKDRFDNLWLKSTKIGPGAGIYDTILSSDPNTHKDNFEIVTVHLSPVQGAKALSNGQPSSEVTEGNIKLYMDLPFPEQAHWQPVRLEPSKANDNTVGFYIDDNGLQWERSLKGAPKFDGWVVCEWWLNAEPQLFVRVLQQDLTKLPSNCADVDLLPQYLKPASVHGDLN